MHSMSDRIIGKLSTGMQQKVSIVRTLIHNPDVIIFDEATTGLDVTTSQNIVKLLQEFKGQGKTIIFSTHRINEIKILCDDMAIIDKGILKYTGTYQNFIDKMQEKTFEDELIRLIEN
jgi:sodium transport system ATP-binding protein